MKNIILSPSMLSANFANLEKDIQMINESQADWFHLDIMDGVFVPNISFGFPVVKYIKKFAQKPLDVHLMIVQPERYIAEWKKVGADILTVHYEACTHLHRTVQEIKNAGMKAGVSLNPHTSVELLNDILPELDMVLIMSVNPGFGGQSFISQSLVKIKNLREMADIYNPNLIIQVDGGVDTHNYKEIIKAGANSLVAGSAIFGSENPVETIKILKS
ncbi:MAG: ribulose-phosphate 3-epimerase [Bacteroidota bacterium]|jgi:ribulose-phosphate 3-epimerase|nr:ribulose-phosphate 3-epimerase [Bacteroidales bacterium]MDI9536048.1 ribulose-phosphate 3-epimerase [Bacteroidota bacterium]OQC45896.1 MAG: Ribulose-phosphate 3-epimerase [Bacteroidetes bacterium ADurb.Bin028]NLP19613.1 ribulose-phosphate 3-epimerase [Bacteroidales bacterium]HNY44069.1 ribulose-phosphate 3-epimerase [Bacteroidales bacterium]